MALLNAMLGGDLQAQDLHPEASNVVRGMRIRRLTCTRTLVHEFAKIESFWAFLRSGFSRIRFIFLLVFTWFIRR